MRVQIKWHQKVSSGQFECHSWPVRGLSVEQLLYNQTGGSRNWGYGSINETPEQHSLAWKKYVKYSTLIQNLSPSVSQVLLNARVFHFKAKMGVGLKLKQALMSHSSQGEHWTEHILLHVGNRCLPKESLWKLEYHRKRQRKSKEGLFSSNFWVLRNIFISFGARLFFMAKYYFLLQIFLVYWRLLGSSHSPICISLLTYLNSADRITPENQAIYLWLLLSS